MEGQNWNKASIERIIEISERMYNQGKMDMMRKKQRAQLGRKDYDNEEQQCTFQPNTIKRKFVKYPNPPIVKKQNDTIIVKDSKQNSPQRQQKRNKERQKQKQKDKQKNKPYPPKRLNLYYRWQEKRKQKMLNNFVQEQIRKSVQDKRQTSPQRNSESTNDHQETKRINRSLSPRSPPRGIQLFITRQKRAKLEKQYKEFRYKNTWAHTSTFSVPSETKIDAVLTNFMNLGNENYQKREPFNYNLI